MTDYSPALFQINNIFYMVYPNQNDNDYLYASEDVPGQGWQIPGIRIGTVPVTSAPTVAAFNGTNYLAFNSNGTLYSSLNINGDGISWGNENPIQIGGLPAGSFVGKPGLSQYGGNLILAFEFEGSIFTSYGNGYGSAFILNAQGLPYVPTSAPALTVLNGTLYSVFTTGNSHNPVICNTTSTIGQVNNAANPCTVDSSLELGNDPAIVPLNGSLYIAGKSNYSEDELWATTTYDGVNFAPGYKYGQTLTQSPSLLTYNQGGNVFECGKSKNGSNIWCYQN